MISISRQNLQNAITDVLTCRSTLPACRLIKTDVLFRLNPKERNLSKPISRPSTVGVAVSSLSKCSFSCFRCPITSELSSRPHFGNSTSPSLPARTRNPLGKKPSTKSLQEWMTVFRNISNRLTGWTSWGICKLKLRQLLFLLFDLIFFSQYLLYNVIIVQYSYLEFQTFVIPKDILLVHIYLLFWLFPVLYNLFVIVQMSEFKLDIYMTINKHGFDIPFAWCTRNPATSTIFFTPMWQYGELYTRGMLTEYNLVIISNNINPVVIFKPFFFYINVQCSNSNFDYYVCW